VDLNDESVPIARFDARRRTTMQEQDRPIRPVRAVAGIDAAITARHHIAMRETYPDGTEKLNRFSIDPTLAGLEKLSRRLAELQVPVEAFVEPTWLFAVRGEVIGVVVSQTARGPVGMSVAKHSSWNRNHEP
jgi:hypothetical protein